MIQIHLFIYLIRVQISKLINLGIYISEEEGSYHKPENFKTHIPSLQAKKVSLPLIKQNQILMLTR